MSDLYIHHHLGLGDMIHLNGMVRRFVRENSFDSVYVFSKNCYQEMTEWMYRDESKIKVIGIDENGPERQLVDAVLSERLVDSKDKFIRIGHEFYRDKTDDNGPMTCDMIFYDQLNIPYSSRFDDCYWERDYSEEERVYKKLSPEEDYIFVHDDPKRGFFINDHQVNSKLKIVRNDVTESIFNLGVLLEKSKEIHLMESSIRCMVEFLKPKLLENNVKLYLHDFRGGPVWNKHTGIWNGTSLPFELVSYR